MTTNAMDAPATRRLQRPRNGRVVAGVSLGLGRYTNVDPVIFRIVFAVLAVFGGAGFVLYAAGWLLMPEEGSPSSHLDDFIARHRRPGRRSWLVVALVTVGLIWAAVAVAHSHPGGVVGAAVLLGVGLLIAREHNRRNESALPTTAAPAAPAADAATAAEPAATYVAQPYVAPPPRQRSPLALLTISVALIAVGLLTALGVAGASDPQPADVVAVALGVIALGLLVGAVWGRAWLLIPLGLVLVLALGIARAIPPDVPWTSGNRMWAPTASDVQSRYALGVGDAHLDLTQLDLTNGRTIVVRLGAGRITVLVPAGTEIDVRARASAGHLQLVGTDRNGTGLDEHTVLEPSSGSPSGRVSLDLRVGFGDVEVDRVAA
jgi:phage shock protein PspC (stress-responsive transcriptional regulator)